MLRAAVFVALLLASAAAHADAFSGFAPTSSGLRAIGSYNALDNGLAGDCTTNDGPKLQTLLNTASAASSGGSRVRVVFPVPPGGCYAIDSVVSVPSNVDLEPLGGVLLQSQAPGNGAFFSLSGVNNVRFGAFQLDSRNSVNLSISQPISVNNSFDVWFERTKLVNPTGSFLIQNSYRVHVLSADVQNSLYHGVYFNNVYESEVLNGYFQNEVGFGVILTGISYKNLIQGNRTTHNGIELVGITAGGYQNRVIGNHAEGTGDNCISITGHENLVLGNEAIGCAGNGINLYGDRNVAIGNYAKNNAQGHAGNASWRAGIAVAQGFGGVGQYNVVSGNVTDDDQGSPTQQYGIWIAPAAYTAWGSGQSVASGGYYTNALKLYQAGSSGTTGATAPTCTSGTCSDGTITWTYIASFAAGDTLNSKNEISGNNYRNSAISSTADQSTSTGNEFVGGFAPLAIPSALQVSSVSNAGGVSGLTINTGGSYNNGVAPTLSIAAPPAGGTQATAVVATMKILGFGSISTGGAGCSVNDILTMVGGTATGNTDQIKVLTVDGSGAVLTFTGQRFGDYSVTPPAGATQYTGGTCTVEPTFTGTVWQLSTTNVTNAGSGYLTIPAVTASSGNSTATLTAALSSSLTVNAGNGKVLMNGTGTSLGTAGTGGAPVLSLGAMIDNSGVRQSLGATYTVPANTSLVRFIQGTTVSSSTVTLPTALADGQPIQFVNYAGAVTALTFSPSVNGWTNGSTLAANTGLRIRWDATSSAWFREQ